MKNRLLLFALLALIISMGCDDGKNKDKENDEVTTPTTTPSKVEPMMGESCVGVDWDNKCYGKNYYTCHERDGKFSLYDCVDSPAYDNGICFQFDGDVPHCASSNAYESCTSKEDSYTRCEDGDYRSYRKNINCSLNLADNKYYFYEDEEPCMNECLDDTTCYTLSDAIRDAENHFSCEGKEDNIYCTTIKGEAAYYECDSERVSEYHFGVCSDSDKPFCADFVGCVEYDSSKVNCSDKTNGAYCYQDESIVMAYSCEDGMVYDFMECEGDAPYCESYTETDDSHFYPRCTERTTSDEYPCEPEDRWHWRCKEVDGEMWTYACDEGRYYAAGYYAPKKCEGDTPYCREWSGEFSDPGCTNTSVSAEFPCEEDAWGWKCIEKDGKAYSYYCEAGRYISVGDDAPLECGDDKPYCHTSGETRCSPYDCRNKESEYLCAEVDGKNVSYICETEGENNGIERVDICEGDTPFCEEGNGSFMGSCTDTTISADFPCDGYGFYEWKCTEIDGVEWSYACRYDRSVGAGEDAPVKCENGQKCVERDTRCE